MFKIEETWVEFLGQEDHLEKEMTTHSSILAWEIPWTEEPGGLQFLTQGLNPGLLHCSGSRRPRRLGGLRAARRVPGMGGGTTRHIQKQRHYFANKGPSSQGYGFSSSHVWM